MVGIRTCLLKPFNEHPSSFFFHRHTQISLSYRNFRVKNVLERKHFTRIRCPFAQIFMSFSFFFFFFLNTIFIQQEHVTSNENRGVGYPNNNPNLIQLEFAGWNVNALA
jgi:hypothetical protein